MNVVAPCLSVALTIAAVPVLSTTSMARVRPGSSWAGVPRKFATYWSTVHDVKAPFRIPSMCAVGRSSRTSGGGMVVFYTGEHQRTIDQVSHVRKRHYPG